MKRKKHGRDRDSSLHLTDKHHPPLAIGSTLLAVVSICIFGAACLTSGQSKGHAGILAGLVGIISLLISLIGFIMAWFSLHQDDIRPLFPTIASVTNGLLVIFYMVLYIWGTVV